MGKAKRNKSQSKNNEPLTERQENIVKLRKRINRREMEEEKTPAFTKQRLISYVWLFAFTPYGLFRIWQKDSGFKQQEKIVYTMIGIVYLTALYLNVVKQIPLT